MTANEKMTVWLVAEYLAYEGMLDGTLRLFHSKDDAEAYAEELQGGYDCDVRVWEEPIG